MADPVIASDGHSYERFAIERWVQRAEASGKACISPMTGKFVRSLFPLSSFAFSLVTG